MKTKDIVKESHEIANRFRITTGDKFRLQDVDPGDTHPLKAKDKARADGVSALAELQDKLNAQNRWALLLIFQAMDAAGKDGAIKHVMTGGGMVLREVALLPHVATETVDSPTLARNM